MMCPLRMCVCVMCNVFSALLTFQDPCSADWSYFTTCEDLVTVENKIKLKNKIAPPMHSTPFLLRKADCVRHPLYRTFRSCNDGLRIVKNIRYYFPFKRNIGIL